MRKLPKYIARAANGAKLDNLQVRMWAHTSGWSQKYIRPEEREKFERMTVVKETTFWLIFANANGLMPKKLKRKKQIRIKLK
jgi:hypothetical protein